MTLKRGVFVACIELALPSVSSGVDLARGTLRSRRFACANALQGKDPDPVMNTAPELVVHEQPSAADAKVHLRRVAHRVSPGGLPVSGSLAGQTGRGILGGSGCSERVKLAETSPYDGDRDGTLWDEAETGWAAHGVVSGCPYIMTAIVWDIEDGSSGNTSVKAQRHGVRECVVHERHSKHITYICRARSAKI